MGISLTDEGTRYAHYTELLDMWESGVHVLRSRRFLSSDDHKRLTRLESAVIILRRQIDVLADFIDTSFMQRQQVNNIPADPTKITGGRGTPLETPKPLEE